MAMEIHLREAREAARMTQEQLAEKSGISRVTISNIENGKILSNNTKTLVALANALGVGVESFFCAEC